MVLPLCISPDFVESLLVFLRILSHFLVIGLGFLEEVWRPRFQSFLRSASLMTSTLTSAMASVILKKVFGSFFCHSISLSFSSRFETTSFPLLI